MPHGWELELDRFLELVSLPDQGLAVNPSASSSKSAALGEVNAHSALWKSILLLQFSLFSPSCQLLASLQVWLLPPYSAISVLSFGSCLS